MNTLEHIHPSRARPKIALGIETETVRPPARFHESRELPLRTPFENPVVRLIGEEDISLRIAGGHFRKREAIRKHLEGLTRSNDLAFGGQQLHGNKTGEEELNC